MAGNSDSSLKQILVHSAVSSESGISMDVQTSSKEKRSSTSSSFTDDSSSPFGKKDSLDSDYSSADISNTDCSSLPSENWECDIETYKKDMPPHIKVGYIDVLILYAEEDRHEAERFQQHLINDIKLDDYGPIKAWLYDCEALQALCESKIGHLQVGVERSTYVFIYLTANFVKDKWMELSSESCLMEAICNPYKMWCVVPVYTQKRSACNFKIPMGLNSLKGINYYNPDKFYQNGLKRLIGDKVKVRINNELEHKKIQKSWIELEKRRIASIQAEQKRLQEFEENRTRLAGDWLNQETNQLFNEGLIPGYPHKYPPESSLLELEQTLSLSASTNSLEPNHAPNAAVEFFKELICNYNNDRVNPNHYSEQELASIRLSIQIPQTPQMNMCQSDFEQPFLNQSVLCSQQQQQQMIERTLSNSALSDSGNIQSSDRTIQIFKLETAEGIRDVNIPVELHEQIVSFPDEEKQHFVLKYLQECRKYFVETNLSHLQNHLPDVVAQQPCNHNDYMNSDNMQHRSNMPYALNQNLQHSQGAALSPDQASTSACRNLSSGAHSGDVNCNIPDLQKLSLTSCQQSRRTVTSGYSTQLLSYNKGSDYTMPGNIPMISLLANDNASLPSGLGLSSHVITQMQESEQGPIKETNKQIPNENDLDNDIKTGNKQKQKNKSTTVIKNYKINVYNANTVQIGDGNIVQDIESKGNIQFIIDNDDDDEVEDINDARQYEYGNKVRIMMDGNQSMGTPWNHCVNDITNTHGEAASSPETATVNATPSMHHPRQNRPFADISSVKEIQIQPQVTNKKFIQAINQYVNEAVPDHVKDKKRNEEKLDLEQSGNMNKNNLTPALGSK